MARKALYKHATQVDTTAYPDDGSSPVGSNEWNADPDAQGMLGFTPANATRTISSGVVTPTDSVHVIAAESGTSDDLDKLAIANTSEYDLIYLFADTGDTITLKNTSSPSADGQIKTVSDADETLSTTKPSILIRKGAHWYGYGGGSASNLTTSSLSAATLVIESEGIGSNDNDTTLPTSAAVKDYVDTQVATVPTGDITGVTAGTGLSGGGTSGGVTVAIDSTVATLTGSQTLTNKTLTSPTLTTPALGTPASGTLTNCTFPTLNQNTTGSSASCTGNAATVTTNANLTGEVTSSGNATTIADNIVDEANLKVSNSPTNGLFLQAQSGNTGGLTWASAGGGSSLFSVFSNSTTTSYAGQTGEAQTIGTAVGSLASGSGDRDVYIRKIDTNNEGVFTVIHKNGALVEVQIA